MPIEQGLTELDLDAPLILVTADSHIGPRLKEDLRDYCPKKYLEEFDDYIRAYEPMSDPRNLRKMLVPETIELERSTEVEGPFNNTTGHHDVRQRLKDMNRDGVAAEVIFHGSQNGQCFPFLPMAGGTFNAQVFSPGTCSAYELEVAAVGQHMYNHWLADQCSVEPERHAGLAHVPMWDVDAAVRELQWARGAGLRGVNFPAPKVGIKLYDELDWEPYWSACEDLGMVLSTHAGADIDAVTAARPHTLLVLSISEPPERILPRLVFSGVFERHPGLRYAVTELQKPYSRWWMHLVADYDDLWEANLEVLRAQVPRRPSEYLAEQIYHGSSLLFLAPQELTIAIRDGYENHFMWGSDYPHAEGAYRIPKDDEEETRTVLALRHALSSAEPALRRKIAGENAVELYGFDRAKLADVARRIGAISLRASGTPLADVPADWSRLARTTVPFPEYHRSLEPV
jgi:predicted TIM-barrel fold metal-dependent hydrolase